jgi:hypothetical protein
MPRRPRKIVVRMATRPDLQAAEAVAALLFQIEQRRQQAGSPTPGNSPA